jgi:hypothetical protein
LYASQENILAFAEGDSVPEVCAEDQPHVIDAGTEVLTDTKALLAYCH